MTYTTKWQAWFLNSSIWYTEAMHVRVTLPSSTTKDMPTDINKNCKKN